MENYNIYIIIGLACLAVTITSFEPLQNQLMKLNNLTGKFYKAIYKVLSCSQCTGLWLSIITLLSMQYSLFDTIVTSSIVSVLASFFKQQINKI